MAITLSQVAEDALVDLPQLVALVNKVEDGIKALPSPPNPATQFEDDAALVAACLPELGKLIDEVRSQVSPPAPAAAKG